MKSSLRFGVFTGQVVPIKDLIKRWKFCEEAGYDSIWVADHFAHWNKRLEPFWECWSLLSIIACYTSKIQFGSLVSNMTWRHPAWLARQALTIDHISGGRLTIGLGSGRHGSSDHEMIVYNDWSTKERVERFQEYVEIIDSLLRNPITTYTGNYYQLNEAPLTPECIQKPRLPILIGTKGKKMLKIVSRFADTWNVMAFFGKKLIDKSFEIIKEKNELLNKYCSEIGRNPKEISRSVVIYEIEAFQNLGATELYNSSEAFIDILERYTDIGFNEIIFPFPLLEKEAPLFEKFSYEVIPEIRKKY